MPNPQAQSGATKIPRVVIAALRGGSGKTTLTLGLISALRDRGVKVAPFKKGPDYIDPFWHAEAAGAPCRNLDPFIMGRQQVTASFGHHSQGFQAAVIEGNRGLFDGMDAVGSQSTAELAKWLAAPVILVVDCSMTSRTVAALVLGCQKFDPEMNLAGVVLNPVANKRQEKVVTQAIEDTCGLPVLGAVPRLDFKMPERHMGLVPPQEHGLVAEALSLAARSVAGHVDLEAFWRIIRESGELSFESPPKGLYPQEAPLAGKKPVIAVIRDAAFGFYYRENLEALENHGAELVFCSALNDAEPPAADAVYIGGGFPETNAAALAANKSFRERLLQMARDGLPIYAECGGLMYLGESLVVSGAAHQMAGVFPIEFHMRPKPQGHGYTVCRVERENPFLPVGYQIKAHEFHYSDPKVAQDAQLDFAYQVERGKGIVGDRGGLIYKNVLGTYHHLHALGATGWAQGMVKAARG